jgi:uncharacterized protein
MRYWDSSALVPLILQQPATPRILDLHAEDSGILTWFLSDIEVHSALSRLAREGGLHAEGFREASMRLEALWQAAITVSLVEAVKPRARRVLRIHPLRAADSLQLGAALAAAYDDPAGWDFVALDDRLREAARAEGFRILP